MPKKASPPCVGNYRISKDQSLQFDTFSGATLTSKAYLQAVENALFQAQQA
jgi:uncharacterized protein with FMN-binding domain